MLGTMDDMSAISGIHEAGARTGPQGSRMGESESAGRRGGGCATAKSLPPDTTTVTVVRMRSAWRSTMPTRMASICVELQSSIRSNPAATLDRSRRALTLILAHGIARVVVGSVDPNPDRGRAKAFASLRKPASKVVRDVMRAECDAINRHFFHYITTGMPYIVDGRRRAGESDCRVCGPSARTVCHVCGGACRN